MMKRIFVGEVIGTFILVFIGIGSVAVSVLFDLLNLYGVALVWVFGVSLGIYASKSLSHSHLNPAVSFGFFILKNINFKTFIVSLFGQFFGAILASFSIFYLFKTHIKKFEILHGIDRSGSEAHGSAMIFGEYFPNPANPSLSELSVMDGVLLEGGGTFFLMLVILLLSSVLNKYNVIKPVLIGLTVGVLIVLIAPYTQAGFNPFRDFGPRLVSYFLGWSNVAFSAPSYGFFTVYILSPVIGAIFAALLYQNIIAKNIISLNKIQQYER